MSLADKVDFLISSDDQSLLIRQVLQTSLDVSAATLSNLSSQSASFSIVETSMIEPHHLDRAFDLTQSSMISIYQLIEGNSEGLIQFIMDESVVISLVREWMGETMVLKELTELEQDVWLEVGNIITNNFLKQAANDFSQPVNNLIPQIKRGNISLLLTDSIAKADEQKLLFAKFDMTSGQHKVTGYLLWAGFFNQMKGGLSND